MKIGPIPAPTSASPENSIRQIKMNVNATPLRYDPSGQVPGQPPQATATPDNDGQAKAEEVTQPLSPQYAAIARQRRALQVKERELADRERAFQQQSNGSSGIDIAQLKSDPLRVLLDNGVTYEQLTEAVLANKSGYNPEVQQLKQQLKALEEGLDSKFSERDAQQEQQALAEMRREAQTLAQTGDTYELVRATNSVPDVMKLIERTYREHGEVLDVSEAMGLIEEELVKDGLRIAESKKMQARLASQVPQQQYQQPRQMRTLTNRDTATPPIDRRARAMAAFYGQLKK